MFGLLAVEIAVNMKLAAKASGAFDYTTIIGVLLMAIAFVFVYRSFYGMRISNISEKTEPGSAQNGAGQTSTEKVMEHAVHPV